MSKLVGIIDRERFEAMWIISAFQMFQDHDLERDSNAEVRQTSRYFSCWRKDANLCGWNCENCIFVLSSRNSYLYSQKRGHFPIHQKTRIIITKITITIIIMYILLFYLQFLCQWCLQGRLYPRGILFFQMQTILICIYL